MFQHTAARRRLPEHKLSFVDTIAVSTHSRTEAAAIEVFTEYVFKRFQHTAARRRLPEQYNLSSKDAKDSTHSRTEAAA